MRKAFSAGSLVIANGAAVSGTALDGSDFKGARGLAIQAPVTLTGTCTVEVSLDGGVSYGTLQSGGADVELPAGGVVVIDAMVWDRLRIASSANEGGERTFIVKAVREY